MMKANVLGTIHFVQDFSTMHSKAFNLSIELNRDEGKIVKTRKS